MMKLLAITLSVIVISTVSAGALEVDIPISSYIINNKNSSTIAIESDRYHFTTLYRTRQQKMDDLLIPFKVISPKTVAENQYRITLMDSTHQCGSEYIDVNTQLDERVLTQGNSFTGNTFSSQSTEQKWSEHKLLLTFPVVNQVTEQQDCMGRVTLNVGLQVWDDI